MTTTIGVTLSGLLSLAPNASPVELTQSVQTVELDWYSLEQTIGGFERDVYSEQYYPYPVAGGVAATYLNKCIDGTTNVWTFWQTSFIDATGTQYPGTTFDSGTYKVETIVYQRESP